MWKWQHIASGCPRLSLTEPVARVVCITSIECTEYLPVSIRTESLPAALADMVSAAFFLTVWLSPAALGADAVSVAFMLVFVEFLLMHGSGILGAQMARGSAGCLALIGVVGGYLLFFLVAAVSFDSIWPLFAFAWLLVGKLLAGGARRFDVTEQAH